MANIVTIQDFTSGLFQLPINQLTSSNLQSVIDEVEEDILEDLLGAELAGEFTTDLVGGVPQSTKFLNLFNKLRIKSCYCNEYLKSSGIKEMIQGFVVFTYLIRAERQTTMVGSQSANSENGTKAQAQSNSKMIDAHCLAVDNFNTISEYILQNESDYPNYEGIRYKRYLSLI